MSRSRLKIGDTFRNCGTLGFVPEADPRYITHFWDGECMTPVQKPYTSRAFREDLLGFVSCGVGLFTLLALSLRLFGVA